MEKSCFVLAYLTSEGRLPLLALNDVVAGVLRGWPSRRVGWILLQAFHRHHRAAKPGTSERGTKKGFDVLTNGSAPPPSTFAACEGVSQQMEWLLELMGHLRSVACCGGSDLPGGTSAVRF